MARKPPPNGRHSSRRHTQKVDLPPGTPMYVGEPQDWTPKVVELAYGPEHLSEAERALDDRFDAPADPDVPVRWIDVVGIHDAALVQRVGAAFGIHPLAIEDVLNPSNRPKFEAHDGASFLLARMISLTGADPEWPHVQTEQVALFAGPGWVLSFQQRPGDPFDAVRARIRTAAGRIRGMSSDYLLHALTDAIVDRYFEVVVGLEDAAERLGQQALVEDSDDVVDEAQRLRVEISTVRRAALPLRDAVGRLLAAGDDLDLLSAKTIPYFRDLHDHLVQVVESTDAARERTQSAIELAIAVANNRMNEVMRVLTVVAAIFIPLTFLAGIYGMNFQHMPELAWRWAYPTLLAVMVSIVAGMLLLFRRRGWL